MTQQGTETVLKGRDEGLLWFVVQICRICDNNNNNNNKSILCYLAKAILLGEDDRVLVIVGPCSIHDVAAAKEYGE
jgi:3-deoxy-D-arabino-heptulosonate 7-phosphate (DAHP) synthase